MDNGASSYRRFLKGDESGFVEIVRDYKDGLVFYINGFVHNLDVAEELTEDTFVRLGIKKPRYKEKASFKTLLYTIGRNCALDYIRKRSRYREISLNECGDLSCYETAEKQYLKNEQNQMLYEAMQSLKEDYRQALHLVYFEGFSCKETALIMKKSTHAAETLLYRARTALKTELIKKGFSYEDL